MKSRLSELLKYYHLSSAQFADNIGVQRSSISHILSGRNKPSYDFLLKILDKYPEISAEWLLTGTGSMLKSNNYANIINNQSESVDEPELFENESSQNIEKQGYNYENTDNNNLKNKVEKADKNVKDLKEVTYVNKVKKVIFVYADNTFEIFEQK